MQTFFLAGKPVNKNWAKQRGRGTLEPYDHMSFSDLRLKAPLRGFPYGLLYGMYESHGEVSKVHVGPAFSALVWTCTPIYILPHSMWITQSLPCSWGYSLEEIIFEVTFYSLMLSIPTSPIFPPPFVFVSFLDDHLMIEHYFILMCMLPLCLR